MKSLPLIAISMLVYATTLSANAQQNQQAEVPVYVAPVVQSEFVDTVEALGTLKANENVSLAATVTELVTAVNFTDGQRVITGDVLIQMDDTEEIALLEEEQSRVDEAQRQVDRFKPLISRGSVSELTYDQSVGALSAAKARLRAVQSRIDQRKIVAPFDGVVGLRNTSVGALLQPGSVVTTIDDDSVMNLDFAVPEVFLQSLVPGLKISATTSAFPDRTYIGEVASVSTRVDPITRSIVVRARIDNADRSLKPGLLMRVTLKRSPRQANVLQEEGIIADGRRNFVLVAVEKDGQIIAERREVQIGARRKGEVEILEGLVSGDLVVTHGTLKARDGSALNVLAVEENNETLVELIELHEVTDDTQANASAARKAEALL
ncbi:MAG TPA: efflux transporter periplasmic adaptor subunit [Gammaproteobacteria bacterium]|nr:efflux transporter periplasmic adaptor subunit [Gammaproteobacteria bacterium]